MTKRLYTREEAADYSGVTVYKIAKAIRDATLPAKRHGKDVVVERADLDAWIDATFEVA
jgi:excisionase family DNA binding protein